MLDTPLFDETWVEDAARQSIVWPSFLCCMTIWAKVLGCYSPAFAAKLHAYPPRTRISKREFRDLLDSLVPDAELFVDLAWPLLSSYPELSDENCPL